MWTGALHLYLQTPDKLEYKLSYDVNIIAICAVAQTHRNIVADMFWTIRNSSYDTANES